MTTADTRTAYLSEPDEFLRRARHDDELREAVARTTGQAAYQPPSPSIPTRRLSNAFTAFAKAATAYLQDSTDPVTRVAITDHASGDDVLVAQMPAEMAELVVGALAVVTSLMAAENRADGSDSSDSTRLALRLVPAGGAR
ncbi:hypothetical protein [Streptomyces sp. NPDC017529]|uniref:hypothetical protein n=1 Tax=Streptomyces sp. NPDC017529 TaxID=3365000 RepID=UPI0037B92FE4